MSADPNTGGGAGTGPGGGAGTGPAKPKPPPSGPKTEDSAADELVTLLARVAPLAGRAAELVDGLVLPASLPRPAESAASAVRLQLALKLAVDAIAELRAAVGGEGGSLPARRDQIPTRAAAVATTGGPGFTLPQQPPVPSFVAARRRLAELREAGRG